MTTDLIPTNSPFQFEPTGLIISGQPTYDDWQAIWYYLKSRDIAMPWIVGDLLNFGEAAYGESIWQVVSEEDYRLVGHFKPGTLRNYKYVAKCWPRERRVYDMAWSAYQATAKLSPDLQDLIMAQAESNGHGRNAVRDTVQGTYPGDTTQELIETNYRHERKAENVNSTVSTIITRLDSILKLSPTEAAKNMFHIFAELKQIVEELRQL